MEAELPLIEGLDLPPMGSSNDLIQLGKVKEKGGWSPLCVDSAKLRCFVVAGPRWTRGAAVATVLARLYAEGFDFTAVDTGRRLRSLLFSGLPVDLHRVGVDSCFNPFSVDPSWSPEDAYFYASLTSKAFTSYAGLSRIHASLLEATLCRLLEEDPAPSPMEVAQGLEAQLDPASARHRLIEELKASLLLLQHGYAASSTMAQSARRAELDASRLSIVELSHLPTAELRCLYEACLLAKLVVKARRGEVGEALIVVEDAHLLLEAQPWSFEDLLAPLMDLGARLVLSVPEASRLLGCEATLTLEVEDEAGLAKIGGVKGREVRIDYCSWALTSWSDLEVDKALESKVGAPVSKLSPPRRRRLTTLEELFVKDEVRQQVYEVLSYLRDSYSTFKALFELMALPREEARRALIKMYRHGLIAQREVGGVKVVTLTDLGRLVLEEYESQVGGGGGEGGVE